MNTCPNCGERVYRLGCVNCDEAAYIDQQEMLTDQIAHDQRMARLREAGLDETNTAAYAAQMKDAGR